jgi:dimethylglycine dehydrogenase
MGYVLSEHANLGEKIQIKMQNDLWNAEIVEDSPYDPKNEKIRLDG